MFTSPSSTLFPRRHRRPARRRAGLLRSRRLIALVLPLLAACAATGARPPAESAPRDILELRPHKNTCEVVITGPPAIGDMRLWVPEGIMSNTGCSSAYPIGSAWRQEGDAWVHEVDAEGLFGPGNVIRVDDKTLECVGVRFPLDSPVRWRTTVIPGENRVSFTLRLTNTGTTTIHKAGAAICLKFFKGDWWHDDHVFVRSGGQVRTLTDLGRDAGQPNAFQAYLVKGQSFDNVFYHEFWGINRHTLDAPVMISEHAEAGLCVGIEAGDAWFLHSNKDNPCTDVMLAFGDIAPGESAESSGRVWIAQGTARELLDSYHD